MEYITYSSGEVARQALNTIATFCNSDEFNSLQSIALFFGAIVTMYLYSTSRDHDHIIKWFVVFGIIPLALINTKATMQIIDKTKPTYTASVANIPYIVALPSHFMGQLMSGLVEKTESIAALPDDERYGRTGMMFGSKLFLMAQSPSSKIRLLKVFGMNFFKTALEAILR
ncbi:conjugal transfer protein TraG N-terminal domain-containing protein [Vibrio sonorensis]|uniref:conjugal transfer protein TraG N-terminal domain-containing protein n=1 Tax=Vibrio sonorensis TaxID=1004316 RepID=UPI0008D9B26D|nr:conjugal transfer protein TraG N-terminal domain-containing protein [Vibrio sonorensis]